MIATWKQLARFSAAAALCVSGAAIAQPGAGGTEAAAPADIVESEGQPNPDEMADLLNAQQSVKQTYTFTRKVNGEVVDTEQRSVDLEKGAPVLATEAYPNTKARLSAAFDSELLTRSEAFEEAKLDFAVADQNRDGQMTLEEFFVLVKTWRSDDLRSAEPKAEETARQRQYRAFLDSIDDDEDVDDGDDSWKEYAAAKFRFMAGAAPTISRKDYYSEYLLDFDAMDTNSDMMLRGDELLAFRASNRGETLSTPENQDGSQE